MKQTFKHLFSWYGILGMSVIFSFNNLIYLYPNNITIVDYYNVLFMVILTAPPLLIYWLTFGTDNAHGVKYANQLVVFVMILLLILDTYGFSVRLFQTRNPSDILSKVFDIHLFLNGIFMSTYALVGCLWHLFHKKKSVGFTLRFSIF